ncbi:MAG: acetylglutamate kinase [Desulfobacteraceae bacterium 4572_19]|nr:MAG: acetylglutamate kinase [Desulfobacteraceae bacterium 4572_19]
MNYSAADILVEALPYIKHFAGKTIVVKYGGHAMVDEQLKKDFAKDIILMKYVGLNPVIVHGGGPQINKVLDSMGISSKFVRGMRYTDQETMDVVEMVLGGNVNKSIVAQISEQGGKAVGLTGKDGDLFLAQKMKIVCPKSEDDSEDYDKNKPPEIIDPGLVGEITHINPEIINILTDNNFIPVIAPVGKGSSGETFNINADFVAGKLAVALNAEKLILLTDVDGVLKPDGSRISTITAGSAGKMIKDNIISGGMIPKIECAVEVVKNGVEKAHIINGTRHHALILELFTDQGVGTEVTQ